MTLGQAARFLDCDESAVGALVKAGRLQTASSRGGVQVTMESLCAYMDTRDRTTKESLALRALDTIARTAWAVAPLHDPEETEIALDTTAFLAAMTARLLRGQSLSPEQWRFLTQLCDSEAPV